MYKEWFEEYHDSNVFECEYGFATYGITDSILYIYNVFVKKEHRKSGKMALIADNIIQIAKNQNCKKVIGFVNFPSKYPEFSLKAQINYGFKIIEVHQGCITLEMEI